MQGEVNTDEVHFIFTAPQTTFGVKLQLMQDKARGTGARAPSVYRSRGPARTSTSSTPIDSARSSRTRGITFVP